MPNYDKKTPVTIKIEKPSGGEILYATATRVQREASRAELGQEIIDFATIDITNVVAGSSNPKPPRARKRIGVAPNTYEESFCSYDKITALRSDGWSIKKGAPWGNGAPGPASVVLYVPINGKNIAWRRPTIPAGITVADIGCRIATAADDDLIFGADFPRLPKYKRPFEDSQDPETDSFSTFGEPGVAFPVADGWSVNIQKQALVKSDFEATKLG